MEKTRCLQLLLPELTDAAVPDHFFQIKMLNDYEDQFDGELGQDIIATLDSNRVEVFIDIPELTCI